MKNCNVWVIFKSFLRQEFAGVHGLYTASIGSVYLNYSNTDVSVSPGTVLLINL